MRRKRRKKRGEGGKMHFFFSAHGDLGKGKKEKGEKKEAEGGLFLSQLLDSKQAGRARGGGGKKKKGGRKGRTCRIVRAGAGKGGGREEKKKKGGGRGKYRNSSPGYGCEGGEGRKGGGKCFIDER